MAGMISCQQKECRGSFSFLMMADQGRGCVWSDEETRALTEVWAEESVPNKLDGSVRNICINFCTVEEVLLECRIDSAEFLT